MTYRPMRGYVPLRTGRIAPPYGIPATGRSGPIRHGCATHIHTRQGDEMACTCGKRWPIGEDHP